MPKPKLSPEDQFLQTAHAVVKHWQEVLRLRDWRITLVVKRAWDMDGAVGYNNASRNDKSCEIGLLDPIDLLEYGDEKWADVEKTIVHELLHLEMQPFQDSDLNKLQKIAQEQYINNLTDALVDTARHLKH